MIAERICRVVLAYCHWDRIPPKWPPFSEGARSARQGDVQSDLEIGVGSAGHLDTSRWTSAVSDRRVFLEGLRETFAWWHRASKALVVDYQILVVDV